MKIEVFKTGEHISANGIAKNWTEEDLQSIVNAYNEQQDHNAPVVIGHPTTNSPAYGWVKALEYKDGVIYAELDKVDTQFAELVNEGKYQKVSIALYENGLLRHVGFLGAVPPAIKGLKPFKFNSEQKYIEINYQENNKKDNDMTTQEQSSLLNWVSKTFNEEVASQIASYIDKNFTKEEIEKKPEPEKPTFSESPEFLNMMEKITALERKKKELEFNEYFNKEVNEGYLVPSQRATIEKLFELNDDISYEFNEGETKTIKHSQDLIKDLIRSFPKQIEFNEIAHRNTQITKEELIKNKVKLFQGVK